MAAIKFEDAIVKLEKIASELESGKMPLDDAIKKYEEAMKLAKFCYSKLKGARKKIEVLVKTRQGLLKTVDMDDAEIEENGDDYFDSSSESEN